MCLDAARQLLLGSREPLDEPLVCDCRRRVIGQRPQQRDLGLVEVVDSGRVGAESAEHLPLRDQRRRGHRAHVGDRHDPIGDRRVREALVPPVVARDDHLAAGDCVAEEADTHRQRDVADELARLRIADARVDRELEPALIRVDQVDHRTVRPEQARRLLDRARQQGVTVLLLAGRAFRRLWLGAGRSAGHEAGEHTPSRAPDPIGSLPRTLRHSAARPYRRCPARLCPVCPIPRWSASMTLCSSHCIGCRREHRALTQRRTPQCPSPSAPAPSAPCSPQPSSGSPWRRPTSTRRWVACSSP